jgi:hypothetical protein
MSRGPYDHRSHRAALESAVVTDLILNEAILGADITYGYEEYLQIVDRFYDDDVEISGDASAEPLRGKERVKSALLTVLGPLHMMAEIAGLDVNHRVADTQ